MKVIVAEKPNVARKIAQIFDNIKQIKFRNITYFQNSEITIISAVGHLYGLDSDKPGFPVFDIKWRPYYEISKDMQYTRDYVDLAKSIKPDEVIIATDFDIEGSLIGYNLVRFALNKTKNIYRMKFSSIVPKELMKAYNNLIEFDYNNAIAGETRHILDWYYGINLSRALMDALKKAGAKNVLSIGRVQGPTLSLVLNREISIMNFVPEEYFSIQLKIEDVIFKHPKAFKSKLEAEAYIKQLPDKISIREEKTQEKVVFTPFDLTTLLTEAYRIHKISPNETMKISQKLYEDGLISYPRTSSQKYPQNLPIDNILKNLKIHKEYSSKLIGNYTVHQGKKDDPAHPAIYPTGFYRELDEKSFKIYDLIVRRFLAALSKPLVIEKTKLYAGEFVATGEKIVEKGGYEIYPYVSIEKELPKFDKNEYSFEVKTKKSKTQPPHRYNEASLIKELEKRELGTKATRPIIINTLFNRSYFIKKKSQIVPTQLGFAIKEILDEYLPEITSEDLTREIEKKLELLQEGKISKEEILEQNKEIISEIIEKFMKREDEIGKKLLEKIKKIT